MDRPTAAPTDMVFALVALRNELIEPYYAMRFIRGDSLRDAINQFHAAESLRRDPGPRAVAFQNLPQRLLDVCNAIEYAHRRGALHEVRLKTDLAYSHWSIGSLHRDFGRVDKALESYERVRAIYAELAQANPSAPPYRADLAGVESDIGLLREQVGQLVEARAAYRHARDIRRELTEANPNFPDMKADLAQSESYLGGICFKLEQNNQALAACQRALGIRQALADGHPEITGY